MPTEPKRHFHALRALPWALAVFAATLLAAGAATAADDGDERGAPSASAPESNGPDSTKEPSRVANLDPSIDQSFDAPEKALPGSPLTLELAIEHPRRTRATIDPDLEKSRWNLVDSDEQSTADEDRKTTRWRLTFQVFRVGKTTLDPFEIVVTDENGESGSFETEPVNVDIRSILSDDEELSLQGSRPPAPIWMRDYTLAWIGGGIGAAALLALLLFGPFRREEETETIDPSRPPEEVALEQLEALRGSDLVERGAYMIFYVRMSEAVRRFLGRRFDFPGPEWTTSEIIERLEMLAESYPLDVDRIASWMHGVDLVKFSGYVPSADEARRTLDEAIDLVRSTDPIDLADDAAETDAAETEAAKGDAADDGDDSARESGDDEEALTDEPAQPEAVDSPDTNVDRQSDGDEPEEPGETAGVREEPEPASNDDADEEDSSSEGRQGGDP